MDFDDLEPRNQPAKPKDLSSWSVDELREYIARLEAEIARAKATIKAKTEHLDAASGIFKR